MTDSPTSTGIGHLNQVLDSKIREMTELRQLLTKQLTTLNYNNQLRQRTLQKVKAVDCQQLKTAVNIQLNAFHTDVLAAMRALHEIYTQLMGRTHTNYRQDIVQLQTELQKQYKLTRSMKSEVEQLKSLVESFMREKKIKEDQAKPVITTVVAPSPILVLKNSNPILEIITEEDECQSTKREPEDLESPHLERPRITIKQYITLECLQSKLNANAASPQLVFSPKFHIDSSEVISNGEKHIMQTPPPTATKQHNSNNSAQNSSKKPARFFLEQFKKSFEKTISENSIDRKNCITASSNLDPQELFSLEDSSKKFESSASTPTDTQMIGKVTFGKEKKFFSGLEESEGEGISEELPKDVNTNFKQLSKNRNRSTTTKSKQKQPLNDKINEMDLPTKNPSYLLAHVKKKLNYNSMSNSNSNNHLKDKERENSYSSRDKTTSSREDRYKLLIKNILNIKEKQNHNQSAILSRQKKKDSQPLSASMCSMASSLFVGDRKIELKYQGAKRQNRRHGRGTLYFSNGLSYEGEFRDGLRCGYGILKFNHIEIYNGDWQNDMLNGQGRVKNCSVISKKKKETVVNSNGLQLHKWISYSGEFRDNRFHGTGTLFLQNGEKFLGKFSHGLAEGEGTFYKNNGEVEFGICRGHTFSQKF